MKITSKSILAILATGLVSCGLMCQQASAVPITGGISYAGSYVSQTAGPVAQPDLLLATQLSFGPSVVTGGTGAFAGILFGTPIVISSPLIFRPPTFPVLPHWTTAGFTFDLLTFFEVAGTTSDTLTLRGTGLFKNGVPADTNAASWVATFNTAGGTFSFSASNASIPDGGMTVALLGLSLIGFAGLRNKLLKA